MVTAFKKHNGVIDAKIDFAEKTAEISYDPAKVKPESLPDALKGTRYAATKIESK